MAVFSHIFPPCSLCRKLCPTQSSSSYTIRHIHSKRNLLILYTPIPFHRATCVCFFIEMDWPYAAFVAHSETTAVSMAPEASEFMSSILKMEKSVAFWQSFCSRISLFLHGREINGPESGLRPVDRPIDWTCAYEHRPSQGPTSP